MTVGLYLGDCLDVMAEMPENSVDSVITDPPYGIFFMSANWDHGIPGVRFWEEALRVAKPGAMLMAFGGTRTHHRLMVAIEDAGWILRDTLMWVYAQGFPKSHDISRAIDKAAGAERKVVGWSDPSDPRQSGTQRGRGTGNALEGSVEGTLNRGDPIALTAPATDLARTWDGWGTALKPAWESVILAMAPLDGTFAQNAEKWGVAGLWIDGCRIENTGKTTARERNLAIRGGNLLARKFETDGVMAGGHPSGRFPANLIHDGSDEVVGLFPVTRKSKRTMRGELVDNRRGNYGRAQGRRIANSDYERGHNDNGGSAARFFKACPPDTEAQRLFYCPKASRKERNAGLEGMEAKVTHAAYGDYAGTPEHATNVGEMRRNHHPTVKPLALMEYLCKLTRTPTGGTVLDPFMGSGTTGIACVKTGRDFIGIEIDADYFEIAEARIAAAKAEPVQAEMPMGGDN